MVGHGGGGGGGGGNCPLPGGGGGGGGGGGCKFPFSVGELEYSLEEIFLLGDGNLRRSDFDNLNLFQR